MNLFSWFPSWGVVIDTSMFALKDVKEENKSQPVNHRMISSLNLMLFFHQIIFYHSLTHWKRSWLRGKQWNGECELLQMTLKKKFKLIFRLALRVCTRHFFLFNWPLCCWNDEEVQVHLDERNWLPYSFFEMCSFE